MNKVEQFRNDLAKVVARVVAYIAKLPKGQYTLRQPFGSVAERGVIYSGFYINKRGGIIVDAFDKDGFGEHCCIHIGILPVQDLFLLAEAVSCGDVIPEK